MPLYIILLKNFNARFRIRQEKKLTPLKGGISRKETQTRICYFLNW